ncbi:hypothetical protein PN451_11000 [Dolichospermum planctonicum CS-1226]|uniref:Uncharacterized protein n=1 Tax=Dolichospermum planctonicum CS-1226 TaxID=3021751 RepID=A0ABT5AIW0_9CYAN|nr:hypothetical protein [Dolichospermum planctonicum CS-1226]
MWSDEHTPFDSTSRDMIFLVSRLPENHRSFSRAYAVIVPDFVSS